MVDFRGSSTGIESFRVQMGNSLYLPCSTTWSHFDRERISVHEIKRGGGVQPAIALWAGYRVCPGFNGQPGVYLSLLRVAGDELCGEVKGAGEVV